MTSTTRSDHNGRLVWYAVLVVVVLAGIVAVLSTRGTDDGEATADVQAQQTSDVQVAESSAETLPEFTESTDDPAIGRTIPTVSGRTLDDEPLTIGPDGKAKIVLFVAHWCPHCQREIPVLTEYLRETPMPDDVELLTVSTAVAEERGNYPPEAWLDNAGWTAPVLADSADGQVASAYGLASFPYFVVADADGQVVFRTSGELTTDEFSRLVVAAQTGRLPT